MLFEQASQACAHSDQQQDEQRRLEAELCAVAELSRDKDCEGGQRNHQADEGEGFFDLHGFGGSSPSRAGPAVCRSLSEGTIL